MPVRHFPAYSRERARAPVFALARWHPAQRLSRPCGAWRHYDALAKEYPKANRVSGVPCMR